MLIIHKKQFSIGFAMTISFFITLAVMFMPLFGESGGHNAFVAADQLFNSISKASTDYSDSVDYLVGMQRGKMVSIQPKLDAEVQQQVIPMLEKANMLTSVKDGVLNVTGDLGALLGQVTADARLMFNNQGEALRQAYGAEPRQALYQWWKLLKAAEKSFKDAKEFKNAAVVGEVIAKSVEVSYNYYGIEPQPAGKRAGILTFALVFYVVYTLWWGFAIFFMAEGVGLAMTKGAKKEV